MQTGTLNLTGNLSIKQGGTYTLPMQFVQKTGLPYDFTDCTGLSQLRRQFSSETATDFTVSFDLDIAPGWLTLSLSALQTAALEPGQHEWDLFITFPTGQVWPALEGDAVVRARVSRG